MKPQPCIEINKWENMNREETISNITVFFSEFQILFNRTFCAMLSVFNIFYDACPNYMKDNFQRLRPQWFCVCVLQCYQTLEWAACLITLNPFNWNQL